MVKRVRWECLTKGCIFNVEFPSYEGQEFSDKFFVDSQILIDHFIKNKHHGFYPTIIEMQKEV